MRRPNRSIEVFDIALMAVVTKAMGAFLVLMLLLMPYYSSGPVGQQNAEELAKAVAEAQQKIEALQRRIQEAARSPEELDRLLEDLQKQLEEAQRLIARLRRDNDALNAQVRRLEERESSLRAQIAQLEYDNEELRRRNLQQSILVSGQLTGWECLDIRVDIGVFSSDTYFERKDGRKDFNVLNYISSLGSSVTVHDDDVIARFKDQAAVKPGHGLRFSQSAFQAALRPGTYFVVLLNRSKTVKSVDGESRLTLKPPAADCRVLVSAQYYIPASGSLRSFYTYDESISRQDYAVLVRELVVSEKGVEGRVPTDEGRAWLKAQIERADKEAADAPPTAPAIDKERLRQRMEELERARKARQSPPAKGTD
jgi:hypothetical protein